MNRLPSEWDKENVNFEAHDYPIGGKSVVCTYVMTPDTVAQMQSDVHYKEQVKQTLVHQLAEYILEQKLCEFTQQDDPARGTKTIKLRVYLAPNEQVKILRTAYKIT